jgi:2-aminobenzoate-CoA ligase
MLWEETWHDVGPEPTLLKDPLVLYPSNLNVGRELLDGSRSPDSTVYLFQDHKITLAELRTKVHSYQAALHSAGVLAGDRVMIRLPDCPEFVYASLAVVSSGAIMVPTFVQYRRSDLEFRVADADIRFIVTAEALRAELPDNTDERFVVLWSSDDGSGTIESHECDFSQPSYHPTRAEDIALILYTSGSTGKPKGTCHTHRDLLATADTHGRYCINPTPADVLLSPAALPFGLGICMSLLYPLRFGAVGVLEPDKSPRRYVELLNRHSPTVFAAVATFYAMLLEEPSFEMTPTSSLRVTIAGGEPLAQQTAEAWSDRTGLTLTQLLGTTELLTCFLGAPLGTEVPRGAIGLPVPGYEVVVRDPDTFHPLRPGEPGVLTVRGVTGTNYWRRPDKQAEAVVDGWNVVPDLVHLDERGAVHFHARQDDVIKSAGFRVSPSQVEEVLISHPAVREVGVVSAPDPRGVRSSVIKAYIVLEDEFAASEELTKELQAFVRAQAAPYLYPRLVGYVDDLPRTSSGKLLRSALRADAWK